MATQEWGSAFLSCSFDEDDETLIGFFKDVIKAMGLRIVVADNPKPKLPADKIRELMESQDALVAILTKRTLLEPGVYSTSKSITDEIAMAFTLGLPLVVFVEDGVEIGGLFPDVTEYVPFKRTKLEEACPGIVSCIVSLMHQIVPYYRGAPPILLREMSIGCRIEKNGSFDLVAGFVIEALEDGVTTDDRFLYLWWGGDYSLKGTTIAVVSLDDKRTVTAEIVSQGTKRVTWVQRFEPPLNEGDTVKVAVKLSVPEPAFPMTREAIEELIHRGEYATREMAVIDGWFTSTPADQLRMTWEFPEDYRIDNVDKPRAVVRLGTVVTSYEPPKEIELLNRQKALHRVELTNRTVLEVTVKRPQVGYMYGVRWVPTE